MRFHRRLSEIRDKRTTTRSKGGRGGGGLYASVAENNAPKAAVFHLPSRTFREPRLGLFDGIRERVDVRRERRGRRRVYARDVVVRACLRNERAGKKNEGDRQWGGTRQERRGSRVVLALTSRWPARPVLLTIWQRSGGPSSRNVAGGRSLR